VKYVFPSTPADPARFIGIGRADITVSYTPDLLTAASKGLKVKALASVFDRNVEGIEVWKSSGITTPKQLEGHTVAIYDFPMAKLNWQTFAAHYGIDTKKVKIVSEGNYGVPLIVANKVDGIDAAAPSELVDSEIQAKKSARFWVYLKQNGIPKAFVSVTMKAVKWSFQHQKEAVNIFVQTYKKDVSPELASKAWAQIVKYDSTRFEPSKPAGWMDPGIWKSYEQFLVQKKFLTTNVNVDDVLTGNRFVGTSK
jgi:ABC-type nitrate/sulfonate/bicarbonate transport system substrate-binding protein